MDNPKLGWVNEVEGRVKRAKSASEDATARRKRAEANLNSLQEILKNAQEEAEDAKLKEEEAFQELKNAEAIQQAVEAKHGVVTLEDDEEEEGKRSDGAVKRRAVTPTEQLENSPRKEPRLDADIFSVTSIEVKGCGYTRVNGKYLKAGERDGHPFFVHEGGRRGRHCFRLAYSCSGRCWAIAHQFYDERKSEYLYSVLYECKATDPFDEKVFHKEWGVTRIGVHPPPQFNLLR